MEEGKLKAILSGVHKDNKNVAQNIVQYIKLREAGHFRYGMAFLVSQVKYVCNFNLM